jgi:hypothetical protein
MTTVASQKPAITKPNNLVIVPNPGSWTPSHGIKKIKTKDILNAMLRMIPSFKNKA